MARSLEGDEGAFAQLYIRYFAEVYNRAQAILRDPHEAEDIAQDVFLSLRDALLGYEAAHSPFDKWLGTLAKNAAINRRRDRARSKPTSSERLHELVEAHWEGDLLAWLGRDEFLRRIACLPTVEQRVILLRIGLCLSPRQTAEILTMSPNAVNQAHFRGLEALKPRYGSAEGGSISRARRHQMVMRLRPSRVIGARRSCLAY